MSAQGQKKTDRKRKQLKPTSEVEVNGMRMQLLINSHILVLTIMSSTCVQVYLTLTMDGVVSNVKLLYLGLL